ncbi:MAG: glycosyltransferase family 4 protein [Muribaculaceae bacterium]|nr:glycosyltransferase family 4 protein [Muribaculaceae bacterium]
MKRILLTGPAPHNIGGISTHLLRLTALLSDVYAFDFIDEGHRRKKGVFNLRSGNIFVYLKKVFAADVVHIHSGSVMVRLLHILICRVILRKKVVVTIHRDITIENRLSTTMKMLAKCNAVIVVNDNSFNALSDKVKSDRLHKIEAFLPPTDDEYLQLPEVVARFVDDDRITLCSNAWKLVEHSGGDLYGLDLCIEAMALLPDNYSLVFVIADNTGAEIRLSRYRQRIDELGISDRVLIYESPLAFVELIAKSDMVLRTTTTDGDAISIREALFMGKKIVASDVVERPVGTVIFRSRDVNSLVEAIKADNFEKSELPSTDYKTIYQNIYSSILDN